MRKGLLFYNKYLKLSSKCSQFKFKTSGTDPGYPVGGRGLPKQLHFENFVCQNERIWTLGGCAPATPPLDPPMGLDKGDQTFGFGMSVSEVSETEPETDLRNYLYC